MVHWSALAFIHLKVSVAPYVSFSVFISQLSWNPLSQHNTILHTNTPANRGMAFLYFFLYRNFRNTNIHFNSPGVLLDIGTAEYYNNNNYK